MKQEGYSKTAAIIGAGIMARNSLVPLLKERGYKEIKVYDTSPKIEEINKLGLEVANNPQEAVKGANLVALCSSLATRKEAIEQTAPFVEDGALYFDIFSIKSLQNNLTCLEKMVDLTSKGVAVYSIHPMHGPNVLPTGQSYPYIVGRKIDDKLENEFFRLFNQKRARMFETTVEEHDKAMAIVQALTWVSKLSNAEAIQNSSQYLQIPLEKLAKFSSLLHTEDMTLTGRILGGNHEVYRDGIILNPYSYKVINNLLEIVELNRDTVYCKDCKGIKEMLESLKQKISPYTASLKIPAEISADVQILFMDTAESELNEIFEKNFQSKKYASMTSQRCMKEASIRGGQMNKLYSKFPIAKIILFRSKDSVNGQYVFNITNQPFPQKLDKCSDRILFSPYSKARDPEKYVEEKIMRIQMSNDYFNPYMNLMSTYERSGIGQKLGELIIKGDEKLEPLRQMIL